MAPLAFALKILPRVNKGFVTCFSLSGSHSLRQLFIQPVSADAIVSVYHSVALTAQPQSILFLLIVRSENPRTGPGSVKDAWQEISNALSENRAASSYTPFTVRTAVTAV